MQLSPTHRPIVPAASLPLGLALALVLSTAAIGQDSRPLASRIPAEDLVIYAEFDGFDAHAADWKNSAAYKALNETTLGILLEDLAAQGLDAANKAKAGKVPDGARLVRSLESVARRGFAFGLNGRPPARPQPTLVIRGGAVPEVSGLMQAAEVADEQAAKKVVKKGDRTITTYGEKPTSDAFIEDRGDLILTVFPNVEKVLAVLDGKAPSATTRPIVAELAKPEGDFRPVGLAFLDPRALGPLPPQAAAIGLDGLERIDYRWGFRQEATFAVLRLLAPAPRKGIFGLFDGATFDKSSLPPLPAGLTGFTVVSMSPGQVFDKLVAIARGIDPNAGDQIAAVQQALDQQMGVKLRPDFLGRLGPKWWFYATPGARAGAGAGARAANRPMTDVVAVVEVSDPSKFGPALGKVLDLVNAQLAAPKPNAPPRPPGTPAPQFRKLAGTLPGYELVLPPGSLPPGPMASLKPTLLLGKKTLAIGLTSSAASSAIAAAEGQGPRWEPTGAFTTTMDLLPKGLAALSLSDPRESLPGLIANLPSLVAVANMAMNKPGANGQPPAGPAIPIKVDPAKIPPPAELSSRLFPASTALFVDARGIQFVNRESLPGLGTPAVTGVMVAMLLPAVQSAREAARRAQCVNNLKQIALAMFNYESAQGSFPPAAIVDKQGKPLLSWRVAILPYIDQQTLYKKFKLDEPWDSPTNKALIQEMPITYACPSRSSPEPGTTTYRVWAGPGTIFDGKQGSKLAQITDGISNTIAVVEAKEAVAWTKPDELPFDPKSTTFLFGAGSNHLGGFNAVLADGAVRFIKATINPTTLRALITRAGGEVISADSY